MTKTRLRSAILGTRATFTRNQTGYSEFAIFNFLDQRREDEEETERNEKLMVESDGTLLRSTPLRFASFILSCLVRFRRHCLMAVILSEAKLQPSPESFRGEARLSISHRFCSDPRAGNN